MSEKERRREDQAYTRAPDFAPPELVAEIASRLVRVCAHFPEPQFIVLVQHVAHIQWKYEQRERHALGLD